MTTEFTNVRFVPPPPSSSSSSRPPSHRPNITLPSHRPRPRQKKSVDYKDRKAVKARHLSRIFPSDWLEKFAAKGVTWDSPDAYAMYLRVHQRLFRCELESDLKADLKDKDKETGGAVGNGKQKGYKGAGGGEALEREEAMQGTLRWILKEVGDFVLQQGIKPNNNNNNVDSDTNGRSNNGSEIETGGIPPTATFPSTEDQVASSSPAISPPAPLGKPLLQPPRGTLAYLVSRSYEPSSYLSSSHTSNSTSTSTSNPNNNQNQGSKRRRGSCSSSSSGFTSTRIGIVSSSKRSRHRSGPSHAEFRGGTSTSTIYDHHHDHDHDPHQDHRNGTLMGRVKAKKKYWELHDRVVWLDRDLGYGVLFHRREDGRGLGLADPNPGGRLQNENEEGEEGEEEEDGEDFEGEGLSDKEVEVPEVRFYRSGWAVGVDKRSGMSNLTPDNSEPGSAGNPPEEDDDGASSDSSSSSSDPIERLPKTEENPSFESTWTLRISCPGQNPLELDDEDPEPAEYILHVSHLAPCLPNKQTAERLLSDILLGVPSLPPLPETVCPTRIVNAQVDLLAEVVAGGSDDIITITPSFNDPKDAFPLDVIPRKNIPATDCSCRVDQLDFDGAWFEVPSSGLDLSTDFQEVLNEVLHGPSRLLGRRLTVMLRDVHFWIDRGLPFMARYITDHSKWIQALGCRAIPASAPDRIPTSNSNSTTNSTVTIWPAGAFDERPAGLVPRVLTVGHGFVLWATPVSGSPAQRWTVDVAGPGTTLVIPFERRIVMFHLTDSTLIETEVCHYQLADPLRRVLSRREDESGPNAFMSDETTSELFLAIEKMTESVQLEDRIADYTFTRKTLLEVGDSARKLAARSQKRRFIAQKEKLVVALEQRRSGLKGVS